MKLFISFMGSNLLQKTVLYAIQARKHFLNFKSLHEANLMATKLSISKQAS